ncbi:MAG TPA: hypothetical protein VMM12_06770 [Longimicrobiales bacterium]|nr:hypothetical protein [Longimicrobiales bacterium]
MAPFRRPERVLLLSSILRTLRWRYCRACTRHFLTLQRDRPTAHPSDLVVPDPAARRRRHVA